jgi:hypothetical protein
MNGLGKLLAGAAVLSLVACAAQTESIERPVGVAAGVPLQADPAEHGAWTYLDPAVDLRTYGRFIIERPTIYRGEGSHYGSLTDAEIQEVADMFAAEMRAALEPRFPVVIAPGPGVARLQLTLIGVKSTVPYVSTATRIIPIGAAINALSAGTGSGGTLTGSVTYGIEVKDSVSGKVVAAAVRDLAPGAFDLGSTMGTMATAREVARGAAAMARARLDEIHGGA